MKIQMQHDNGSGPMVHASFFIIRDKLHIITFLYMWVSVFFVITDLQVPRERKYNQWKCRGTENKVENVYRSSSSVSTFFPISEFSYFIVKFFNHIFFVINFSYFVTRFLLNSSVVKSDNKIGKVNDENNMI